ncbi:MAG: hypothetical protein V3T80_08425 [Kiloniellales bacterium]|jgi:hypothetical protein
MEFHVFQCKIDRDCFIVSDAAHVEKVSADLCTSPGDELEKIGVFHEMGEERVAFDEQLAKNSIRSQGFYRFEARSFDPVAERPLAMP